MTQRTNLGDYTLLKQLGAGSMGTAYLAEHRLMKQPCLVKVLPQELSSDSNFIHRFENEVLALSSLEHPHIVKIHNVSCADGQYFLVTDCIVNADAEPCNLSQYLLKRKYKLSEEEIVRIARQIASALDYAHQRKMGVEPFAHGTLKLNNILIRTSKEGLHLYLSDFGLSRIIGPGAVLSRTYKAAADQLATNIGFTWNKRGEEKYTTGKIDTNAMTALHESFFAKFCLFGPGTKAPFTAALQCCKSGYLCVRNIDLLSFKAADARRVFRAAKEERRSEMALGYFAGPLPPSRPCFKTGTAFSVD